MRGLKGKRAIVTGGAQGIGRACVEAFIGHGGSVIFSDVEEETGAATEREVRAKGGELFFRTGDMADEAFCRSLVESAEERLGGVDFLVNNAFSFIAAGLEATRDEWLRSLAVGPLGFATMTQLAAPVMQRSGGGAIVNLSSISAHIAQPNRWTYNAAKGAVSQLTKCAALDLAPLGIRVNSVSPGWIWTRAVDAAAGYDREKYGPIWASSTCCVAAVIRKRWPARSCFCAATRPASLPAPTCPFDGGYLG
ncbi:MAG: SDR family oxidoreductase, partial [Caldilineaceae bacterium]|nr:SDR family oxidoreductase [Caldilineaceae bacterium]